MDRKNRYIRYPMRCGVPQGSVLGPTLWNVGYDSVLRTRLPIGCSVLCYADDILLVGRGLSFGLALIRAELGAAVMLGTIERLDLSVSMTKTETIRFAWSVPRAKLKIGNVKVEIQTTMKYLGLVLDSKWTFREHFRCILPKALGMAVFLGRLTANIGRPVSVGVVFTPE